jgi:hypothetical protein
MKVTLVLDEYVARDEDERLEKLQYLVYLSEMEEYM